MKLIYKCFIIFLLLIIYICILKTNVVVARSVDADEATKSIFKDADDFVSGEIDDESSLHIGISESSLKTLSKIVSNVLMTIGVFVAFIMIAIMGIKFMMQSTEEKAQIKESLMPFLIGLIVTFGAFSIWKIAISILSKI